MLRKSRIELSLTIFVIVISGASASLLIFSPLGIVSYVVWSDIAIIPSIIAIFTIGIMSRKKFPRLCNRIFVGMAAGALATLVLEAIRIPAYMVIKWMPMDSMISLPGLLLTGKIHSLMEIKKVVMASGIPMNLYHAPLDAFAAGALWHFWNGATFGIIYALIIGRGKWWYGMIWAFLIEIGMMLAPYMIMMQGPFGIKYMDSYNVFAITLIAHLLFGALLGFLVQRWKKDFPSIMKLRKLDNI